MHSKTKWTAGAKAGTGGVRQEALRLNDEGAVIARELKFPEGEANSHVNLATNYLVLDQPERAKEHLDAAERALQDDKWFR